MRSLTELQNLDGRRALVTGGAGHIGQAAAETLLELGARVALLDCDGVACETRAKELGRQFDAEVVHLTCDLRDEVQTREATQAAIDDLDGLDLIVHSAGYVGTTSVPGWAVEFGAQTGDAWDAAIAVNLKSAFTMAQTGRDALARSGHGSVIFISSIYGLLGPDESLYEGTSMVTPAGYSASKSGLLGLMRHLATILAPKVRVNAITLGGVWRKQPESFREKYGARTPLGRMASEEDIKGGVAYLASDLSAYVTGQNIIVDGGWTAW